MNKAELWLDALDDACCQLEIPMPENAAELAGLLASAAENMGQHEFHDRPSAIQAVDNSGEVIKKLKRQLRDEVSRRTGVPAVRLEFTEDGLIYHNAYHPHEGVGQP